MKHWMYDAISEMGFMIFLNVNMMDDFATTDWITLRQKEKQQKPKAMNTHTKKQI